MSPMGTLICRGVRGKEQRSSSQKSTEQLFEFIALFVGNAQHTAIGEFISQLCDDSFFVSVCDRVSLQLGSGQCYVYHVCFCQAAWQGPGCVRR